MVDMHTEYEWERLHNMDLTFDGDLSFVWRGLQSNGGVDLMFAD